MATPVELLLNQVRKENISRNGQTVEILKGIDLEVMSGALTVIVGPSGGGKSTLVRLLNRLEEPSGGRIHFCGEELRAIPVLELRQRIGLVPQKPFMFLGSVLDNLQLPFHFRHQTPPRADDPKLLLIVQRCGLEAAWLDREARSLSLGQQQRVSLARTLLPGPTLLVLDEPTSALDRPTGDRLADTLRTICRDQGLTVLMVTHDLRQAARIADRMAYLEDGRILESGPAGELLAHPRCDELRRFLAGTAGEEEP